MDGRVVLFDIDGTLVDTRGAGMEAIRRAVHDLHGVHIPSLDLSGATDSGLARDILSSIELEVSEQAVSAFYSAYLVRLEEHLGSEDYEGIMLPGVRELLDAFQEAGAILGLLTGNVERGARLKIEHYGLGHYFEFGAYGNDHHDRNKLGPVAMGRAEAHHGRPFDPAETVIIGDTPKDIACGKAIGAMTVGVATGNFEVEELLAHEPTLVVEAFHDPDFILAAVGRPAQKGV